jgi:hypothetical protein
VQDLSERDRLRERHAGEPGRGHLIEQLLGRRENLAAYGQATGDVDAQLAHLGYVSPAERSKEEAAAARAAAAAGDERARARPPRNRSSRPRQTAADRREASS